MTNPAQPKPTPVPAILVYGTPSDPALTQASWFRAEDKEAVKAAAKELKFSVIELQTDADRALAAGRSRGRPQGQRPHDRRLGLRGGLPADRGACPQGRGPRRGEAGQRCGRDRDKPRQNKPRTCSQPPPW